MKVVIAGSRDIVDQYVVNEAINESDIKISEIVSGCARGVDTLGEIYARDNNIQIVKFPANWKRYGKAAGPMRNSDMAEYADVLIAIWDGKSRGTQNMINEMKKRGKAYYVYIVDDLPLSNTSKHITRRLYVAENKTERKNKK